MGASLREEESPSTFQESPCRRASAHGLDRHAGDGRAHRGHPLVEVLGHGRIVEHSSYGRLFYVLIEDEAKQQKYYTL